MPAVAPFSGRSVVTADAGSQPVPSLLGVFHVTSNHTSPSTVADLAVSVIGKLDPRWTSGLASSLALSASATGLAVQACPATGVGSGEPVGEALGSGLASGLVPGATLVDGCAVARG